MKLLLSALLALCLNTVSATTLRKDPFRQKLDSINIYLKTYDALIPREDDELVYHTQNRITVLLIQTLNDPRILSYDLGTFFTEGSLGHTQSADGQVHIFSLDEKTGGTFLSNISILHTRNGNTVHAESLSDETEYGAFGFYEIYLLDPARHEYLALGAVRSCNTCEASCAVIIQTDSAVTTSMLFSIDYRFDYANDFSYDAQQQELSWSYQTRSDDPWFGSSDNWQEGEEISLDSFSGKLRYRNGEFHVAEECRYSEVIPE